MPGWPKACLPHSEAWPLPRSWEVTAKPLECPAWKGVTVHLGPWAWHTDYANGVTEGGAWPLQCQPELQRGWGSSN